MIIAVEFVNKKRINEIQVTGVDGERKCDKNAACALIKIVIEEVHGGWDEVTVRIVVYVKVSSNGCAICPHEVVVDGCRIAVFTQSKRNSAAITNCRVFSNGVVGQGKCLRSASINASATVSRIIANDVIGKKKCGGVNSDPSTSIAANRIVGQRDSVGSSNRNSSATTLKSHVIGNNIVVKDNGGGLCNENASATVSSITANDVIRQSGCVGFANKETASCRGSIASTEIAAS